LLSRKAATDVIISAAVAGEIYRELNHRFGTAINLQVATTADDEEKDADSEEGANAAAGTGNNRC
jgi:hypothetical protein